jgi:hypothetical protein
MVKQYRFGLILVHFLDQMNQFYLVNKLVQVLALLGSMLALQQVEI